MSDPHMVEQIIKYSDGSEKVIKYRGVIENGVLIPDKVEEVPEEPAAEEPAEAPEADEEAAAEDESAS